MAWEVDHLCFLLVDNLDVPDFFFKELDDLGEVGVAMDLGIEVFDPPALIGHFKEDLLLDDEDIEDFDYFF